MNSFPKHVQRACIITAAMLPLAAATARAADAPSTASAALRFKQSEVPSPNQDAARDLEQEARGVSHRVDVSVKGLTDTISQLESEREKAMLAMAGIKAQRDVYEEKIVEVTRRAQDDAEHDEIYAELAKVVGFKEQEASRLASQVKAGVVTESQLATAQAELAQARVGLLERKQAVVAAAGGGSLTGLNQLLIKLEIDRAEKEATIEYLKHRLDELAQALEYAKKAEKLDPPAR
jgi:hypothetical protein